MENTYKILLFISLLGPLASFVAVSVSARSFRQHVVWISLFFMLPATVSSAFLLYLFGSEPPMSLTFGWFSTGDLYMTADFMLSGRSLIMMTVVALISLLVHVYSAAYMEGDTDARRYFAILGFFTFSMQGIVLSDNLLLLFVFWELVGFSSYMLIGHWTKIPAAGRAATKAFVLNRIGDAGFMVGLMIVWATYHSFNLTQILAVADTSAWQTAASLCIFCGVVGKSAQFPLFTWLPDAMEGPTPVSALIHAATMVAAGVYLLIRVFGLFTEDALLVVAITGMVTTLLGALAALSQYDIKKILAYSTMSQLGLMVLALGMGVVDGAFLHLLTHAFFKAGLFLSAGMVIHSLHRAQSPDLHYDVQDIRNLGGLRNKLPAAFLTFLVCGASLAGVPFFSGFLSKEAILMAVFTHSGVMSWIMIVVILSVSFLTVLYTFRMIWFIFMGDPSAIQPPAIKDAPWVMRVPVFILAFGSLWFLVSWNPFDVNGWMLPHQPTSANSLWITIFSTLWVVGAMVLSWFLFRSGWIKTSGLLKNGFFVDSVYEMFSRKSIQTSNRAVTWFERSVIDGGLHAVIYGQVIFAHVIGWVDRVFIDGAVNGTARLTGLGGKITRSFQGGNIQLYIFWAALTIIIFIIWTLK